MYRTCLILTILAPMVGCRHGVFTKYAQESCCPTDIRQTHKWCWGEDALFDTPCGPDEAYHGYKPTCWRPWPSPGSVWRDEQCGGPPYDHGSAIINTVNEPTSSWDYQAEPSQPMPAVSPYDAPASELEDPLEEEFEPFPDEADSSDILEDSTPELPEWPAEDSGVAPEIQQPPFEYQTLPPEQGASTDGQWRPLKQSLTIEQPRNSRPLFSAPIGRHETSFLDGVRRLPPIQSEAEINRFTGIALLPNSPGPDGLAEQGAG